MAKKTRNFDLKPKKNKMVLCWPLNNRKCVSSFNWTLSRLHSHYGDYVRKSQRQKYHRRQIYIMAYIMITSAENRQIHRYLLNIIMVSAYCQHSIFVSVFADASKNNQANHITAHKKTYLIWLFEIHVFVSTSRLHSHIHRIHTLAHFKHNMHAIFFDSIACVWQRDRSCRSFLFVWLHQW